MNGYNVLTDAVRLIGLETPDDSLKIRGLAMINTILCELGYHPIRLLSQKTEVYSAVAVQALIVGTAMLIANSLGDSDCRNALSSAYNDIRRSAMGNINRIRDVMPKGDVL